MSSSSSHNQLEPKHLVDKFWPMRGKKVMIRADFNTTITNGVIHDDSRIRDVLPTVKRVLDRQGIVILISHVGRPQGIPYDTTTHDELGQRKYYLKTWVKEAGAGKTDFFAKHFSDSEKMVLLYQSSKADELEEDDLSSEELTDLFSTLDEAEKTRLLDDMLEEKRVTNGEHVFPYIQQRQTYKEELTLKPVAKLIQDLLTSEYSLPHTSVVFAQDPLHAEHEVDALRPGQVLVLENVRFYNNETSVQIFDRLSMAKQLCSYGDYFVSDAFGLVHRNSVSMTAMPRTFGHAVVGDKMASEIRAFASILANPQRRPTVVIVGGVQTTDKILLLKHILRCVDYVIIAGAIAFPFLKAQGKRVGKSFIQANKSYTDQYAQQNQEEDTTDPVQMAASLLKLAKSSNVEISLPVDHVCFTKCVQEEDPFVTHSAYIPDEHMGLDVGPTTIANMRYIIRKCRLAIWHGPLGVCEIPSYAKSTSTIATVLASSTEEDNLISVVAGEDTIKAVAALKLTKRMTHVTTGGSAALHILGGMLLPGLSVLNDETDVL